MSGSIILKIMKHRRAFIKYTSLGLILPSLIPIEFFQKEQRTGSPAIFRDEHDAEP
jgi:hypothetical protein